MKMQVQKGSKYQILNDRGSYFVQLLWSPSRSVSIKRDFAPFGRKTNTFKDALSQWVLALDLNHCISCTDIKFVTHCCCLVLNIHELLDHAKFQKKKLFHISPISRISLMISSFACSFVHHNPAAFYHHSLLQRSAYLHKPAEPEIGM